MSVSLQNQHPSFPALQSLAMKTDANPELVAWKMAQLKNEGITPYLEEMVPIHGCTPAHLAILSRNYSFLKELLKEGVWLSRENERGLLSFSRESGPKKSVEVLLAGSGGGSSGLCPTFYAKILAQPRVAHFAGREQLREFMSKQVGPSLDINQTYAQNTDDFGVVLKKLLIGKDSKGSLTPSLGEVCKALGIELKISDSLYYPRDFWFRMPESGAVRTALQDGDIKNLASKAESKAYTLGKAAGSYYPFPGFFNKWVGHIELPENVEREQSHFALRDKSISFYGEGGNQFVMTNRSGKKCLLVGKIQRDISHLFFCKDPKFEEQAEKLEIPKPTLEKITKILHKMFSQGLLKVNGEDGFLPQETLIAYMSQARVRRVENWPNIDANFLSELIEKYKPFKMEEPEQKDCDIAIRYLKQKKRTRQIMAEEYSFSEEQVVLLPNLFCHLDRFMFPAPNHSVFLPDFKFTAELLRFLKDNASLWNLSVEDLEILDVYISSTDRCHEHLQPLLNKIKKRLDVAEIGYIPTPGLFLYDDQEVHFDLYNPRVKVLKELNIEQRADFLRVFDDKDHFIHHTISFFNGVTGFSEKTERHFFITERQRIGNHLGELLSDCFTMFLKQLIPDIDVFFIGHSIDLGPHLFKHYGPIELAQGGGLHCRTFSVETESHHVSTTK